MPLPIPTEAELSILQVLWQHGPSTVRAAHQALQRPGGVGYTTVLKLLQIMTEKGLVRRDTSQRAHVYEAVVGEASVQDNMIHDLLNLAFGGSAKQLIQRALSMQASTPEELDEIRALLDEIARRT